MRHCLFSQSFFSGIFAKCKNPGIKLVILLLFFLFTGSALAQTSWKLKDAQGRKIDSIDWQGKWLIINYWASWCDSCAKEIPQLNLFYQRNKKQLILLGVNYDNLSAQNLASLINSMHISFPILQSDPGSALGLPKIEVLPTTFIINPQGKIIKELLGPQTAKGLERIINDSP